MFLDDYISRASSLIKQLFQLFLPLGFYYHRFYSCKLPFDIFYTVKQTINRKNIFWVKKKTAKVK
jgi:hypothetical protein